MCYKHFQGDCLFPRSGFRQRLLTSCAISFWVADPGPYLNLTLDVTEASTHASSMPSQLSLLQPFCPCWFGPCHCFLRAGAMKNQDFGFLNEHFWCERRWFPVTEAQTRWIRIVLQCGSLSSGYRLNILIPFDCNIWSSVLSVFKFFEQFIFGRL